MPENEIIHSLARYYRLHRPDLTNPQVSLVWVNTIGWESEIYAFTLTSGKADLRCSERRVLRLLTGGRTEDAEREYHILTLLNKSGYPVPQVYDLGYEEHGLGYPFIIMQLIEGSSFADRFNQALPNDPVPLQQFISLFRQLHSLDWRPYVDNPDAFEKQGDPFYHFERVLAEYASYLSRFKVSAFEPLMGWLYAQRDRAACPHGSIVHLDFHHNNILEDPDGRLYVIDWTSAEISDYRLDLGWTLTLALAYSGSAWREMILEAYERQMGQSVPALDVFEVAAILRRIGTVMISLQAGAEALGMRPEAVEVMWQEVEPLKRLHARLCRLTGLDLPGIGALIAGLE